MCWYRHALADNHIAQLTFSSTPVEWMLNKKINALSLSDIVTIYGDGYYLFINVITITVKEKASCHL